MNQCKRLQMGETLEQVEAATLAEIEAKEKKARENATEVQPPSEENKEEIEQEAAQEAEAPKKEEES